jgi:Tfp pilus assembly protein PilF
MMPMATVNDYLQRAVAALAVRDMKRAEKLTRDLLAKDATNVEAWTLLAYIYQEAGQPERAIEPATRAAELEPDNLQHWNTLGYLYLLLKRWSDADKCFARVAANPDAPATLLLNHAWALIELGQTRAASQQLHQALGRSLEDELAKTIREDARYVKLRPLLDRSK